MLCIQVFVNRKQRIAGGLNQRFEPPVEFYLCHFVELFEHLSQLVFEQDFKHEIRPEK